MSIRKPALRPVLGPIPASGDKVRERFSDRRLDREFIILTLFSIFAVAPLLSPGYFFDAHDADHSVFFLVEFDAAIRDGAWWPRWGPDHALGYGYPLWLVYAPLAYYVAEAFHLAGLGFTAAVKATWAVAFLFGGWGMVRLLRHWWGDGSAGRAAALVGGLLYVYAPYHLVNIYVRAALAEFAALAWLPWVVLAFEHVLDLTPRPLIRTESAGSGRPGQEGSANGLTALWRAQAGRWGGGAVALAALALAGLFLTHSGTILIFTPLLLAYLAFAVLRCAWLSGFRPLTVPVQEAGDAEVTLTALGLRSPWPLAWRALWQTTLRLAAAGLLAVGLAAIFLLPLILERRYIVQSQWIHGSYGYRGHFVFASQFLDPFWGYGYSDDPTGPNDGMSFQLGIVAVVLALVAAVIGLRRGARQRSTTAFFLVATVAVLLLMLPIAQPLWDAVGPAALIQFPWRLLGLTSFTMAILAGAAVANLALAEEDEAQENAAGARLTEGRASAIGYALALVVVLASFPYTRPQYTDIEPIDESPLSIIRFETTYPDMIGMTAFTQQAPTDSPLVDQYRAGVPLRKATLISGSGQVETLRVGGASVTARVDVDGPATVLFYTYDFPGWRATVDGRRVPHRTQPPYGLIAVDVPAGQHLVAIRHGTTAVRTIGTVISALSLLLAVSLLLYSLRIPRSPDHGSGQSSNQEAIYNRLY